MLRQPMQNFINENMLTSWALTGLVEFVVWLVWIRREPIKLFGYCIAVNTLTQPLAVWIYHSWALSLSGYQGGHVPGILLVVEVAVLAVEWVLIKWLLDLKWFRSLLIALSANVVTAAMSFLY